MSSKTRLKLFCASSTWERSGYQLKLLDIFDTMQEAIELLYNSAFNESAKTLKTDVYLIFTEGMDRLKAISFYAPSNETVDKLKLRIIFPSEGEEINLIGEVVKEN